MDVRQLTGYYTYRSFLNNPMPVDDFNQIKFAEAESFLNVHTDGPITGTLSFPAQYAQAEKQFMDITKGSLKSHKTNSILNLLLKDVRIQKSLTICIIIMVQLFIRGKMASIKDYR